MSVVQRQVEKYIRIGEKHGLNLTEVDIMYLQALVKRMAREEIKKAREIYGKQTQ